MLYMQLAALALALAALAASGCGGSSKTGSTTAAATTPLPQTATAATVAPGQPLTRAQLIATADAICARTNARRQTVSIITRKDFARVVPEVAVYDNTEANELGKLVPPAPMAHEWAQVLGYFQLYGEYVSRMAEYAQANNLKGFSHLYEQAETLHQKLHDVATRAGFKRCPRFI
jgi:hypothetical protein